MLSASDSHYLPPWLLFKSAVHTLNSCWLLFESVLLLKGPPGFQTEDANLHAGVRVSLSLPVRPLHSALLFLPVATPPARQSPESYKNNVLQKVLFLLLLFFPVAAKKKD